MYQSLQMVEGQRVSPRQGWEEEVQGMPEVAADLAEPID